MLLGCVFVAIGITQIQERKTERALARCAILAPVGLVIREGQRKPIAGVGATNPCYVAHRTDQLE